DEPSERERRAEDPRGGGRPAREDRARAPTRPHRAGVREPRRVRRARAAPVGVRPGDGRARQADVAQGTDADGDAAQTADVLREGVTWACTIASPAQSTASPSRTSHRRSGPTRTP